MPWASSDLCAVEAAAFRRQPVRPAMVLVTCILASSLAFIDGSVANVGLPAIGKNLQGDAASLQWVVNAYLLPLSALLLLGGALGDRFGRRGILIGGTALFAVGSALCGAAPSLLDQGALIRKARFPRELVPAAGVAVQVVTFLVVLGLVGIVTVAVRGTFDVPLVLLPVLLTALIGFVLGLALAVSVLHAYFRDVAPILGAMLLPWFFLSPIFFEPSDITEKAWARDVLTWVNPMAPFITAIRDVLYGGAWPSLGTVLYVVGAAVVALAGGLALFRKLAAELAVVV